MSAADDTSVTIECPQCGHKSQKSVAWLVPKDRMPCRKCGHFIDLKSGDIRFLIEKLADECSVIDRTLAADRKEP
jgi:peptide subunit release factor 1 (eRF1)